MNGQKPKVPKKPSVISNSAPGSSRNNLQNNHKNHNTQSTLNRQAASSSILIGDNRPRLQNNSGMSMQDEMANVLKRRMHKMNSNSNSTQSFDQTNHNNNNHNHNNFQNPNSSRDSGLGFLSSHQNTCTSNTETKSNSSNESSYSYSSVKKGSKVWKPQAPAPPPKNTSSGSLTTATINNNNHLTTASKNTTSSSNALPSLPSKPPVTKNISSSNLHQNKSNNLLPAVPPPPNAKIKKPAPPVAQKQGPSVNDDVIKNTETIRRVSKELPSLPKPMAPAPPHPVGIQHFPPPPINGHGKAPPLPVKQKGKALPQPPSNTSGATATLRRRAPPIPTQQNSNNLTRNNSQTGHIIDVATGQKKPAVPALPPNRKKINKNFEEIANTTIIQNCSRNSGISQNSQNLTQDQAQFDEYFGQTTLAHHVNTSSNTLRRNVSQNNQSIVKEDLIPQKKPTSYLDRFTFSDLSILPPPEIYDSDTPLDKRTPISEVTKLGKEQNSSSRRGSKNI